MDLPSSSGPGPATQGGGGVHARDPPGGPGASPRLRRARPPGTRGGRPICHARQLHGLADATDQAVIAIAPAGRCRRMSRQTFERLPKLARADALEGRIDRAVIDLAEAGCQGGKAGFRAPPVVTDLDERGADRFATAGGREGLGAPGAPGDAVRVR